jgi:hypothetical protein
MNKSEFVEEIKLFRTKIVDLKKTINSTGKRQIFGKHILRDIETLATLWFDRFESPLRHFYKVELAVIGQYHDAMGKLLKLSTMNPASSTVIALLQDVEKGINQDILVPVLKYQTEISKHDHYSNILVDKTGVELEYLKEAAQCADAGYFRAAIILGWAAAVDRLHQIIIKNGLDKFNNASLKMSTLSKGRYKQFNKKFNIQNLSDLRMSVFDNDLLWVLEFLGLIDGNEHKKLEICFTLRTTCAHPGEAKFSPENIASFFSDLDSLVFRNQKFKLT